MHSSARGTMRRMVLRRASSAARLSPFTAARYESTVAALLAPDRIPRNLGRRGCARRARAGLACPASVSALRYREVPPPADLRWAVECFWFAEGPAAGTERIVPDGCPELVVQLGGEIRAGDERAELRAQPRALVVGQRSRALLVTPRSSFRTVAVRLRPSALGRVLHDDADRLTDGWGSLEDLFGHEGRTLHARVEDAVTDAGRCDALARFLRRRLEGTRPDLAADGAVQAVRRARGRITVHALRAATGASERTL